MLKLVFKSIKPSLARKVIKVIYYTRGDYLNLYKIYFRKYIRPKLLSKLIGYST